MSSSKIFRIFVVEDNPADVYLLRMALEEAGLQVDLTVIDNGAAALAFIRSKGAETPQPDLAVLDLNLPAHDGIEVLTAMRENEHMANIPVAVMSSTSAAAEREQVERLKVKRFISKPPDLQSFLAIGNVLKEVLLETATERETKQRG